MRVDPDLVTASSQESAAPAPVLHQMVTVKAAQEEIKMRPNPAIRPSIPKRGETEFMSPPKGGKNKDLRLAAIFGAAGLVALIIGGSPLNVLGSIAILVGLFLFVRWIIRR